MITPEEWYVIITAAVIFVLINIVMWSIIAAREKRRKQADIYEEINSRTIRAGQETTAPQNIDPPRRTKHFTIKENIVIVHTDEKIQ